MSQQTMLTALYIFDGCALGAAFVLVMLVGAKLIQRWAARRNRWRY